jgi:alanine-synthesizing transaminase
MERLKPHDLPNRADVNGGGANGQSGRATSGHGRAAVLPPYAFTLLDELKEKLRRAGRPVYDFGLGNPDGDPPRAVVDAMVKAARTSGNHRYAPSKGILPLRRAIARWYRKRFDVEIDPDSEAVVSIGSKEGIAHLLLATVGPGDVVLAPDPCYPIHRFGPLIAGARVHGMPTGPHCDPRLELDRALAALAPEVPKLVILNFPHNPTTATCDLALYEHAVALARQRGFRILSDLAYADLVFEGGRAASIFEVPGAKDVAVETFTLSKSYNMPGWRVGFVVGNPTLVGALARLKAYLDYGTFAPIQLAAVEALTGSQKFVSEVCETYRARRDLLVEGLARAGWPVTPPAASMFVWAPLPDQFRSLGSRVFAERLLQEAHVAVSPGVGFGEAGEGYVRFALVEDEPRTRQALRRITRFLKSKH